MKSEKRYSSSFLWRVGTLFIILNTAGVPLVLLVIIKLLDLYELKTPFDNHSDALFGFFVAIVVLTTTWIYISNWWKSWALKSVKAEDLTDLEMRISDKKESFIIKKWSDLNTTNKIIRTSLIVALYVGCRYGDDYRFRNDHLLKIDGRLTTAKIISINKEYRKKKLYLTALYKYTLDSIEYSDEHVMDMGWFLFPEEFNGFSIKGGDEFTLTYQKSNPLNNRINLQEPINATRTKYSELTKHRILKSSGDSLFCDCLVDSVFVVFGLKGVATIYNRDKTYWENENYNRIKYRLLIGKEAYKRVHKKCEDISKLYWN